MELRERVTGVASGGGGGPTRTDLGAVRRIAEGAGRPPGGPARSGRDRSGRPAGNHHRRGAADQGGIDASNYPADMFHMTGSNHTRYFYFCTKNEELSEIGVLELKIDGNVLNWENWSTTGVVHDYSDRQWKQIDPAPRRS